MPTTFWDMGTSASAESWRRIRALRASPPPGVSDDRRTLFGSALEQAEQQFRTARTVGYLSRPLNLFYGLSQAGRAVAAAFAPAGASPRLSGHGIRCPDLARQAQALPDDFPDVKVTQTDAGSFVSLSTLLESGNLTAEARLGDVWRLLTEAEMHAPLEPDRMSPAALIVSARRHNDDARLITVETIPGHMDEQTFAPFASAYPSLAGLQFVRVSGHGFDNRGDPVSTVEVHDRSSNDAESYGTAYRGSRVILPSLPGSESPLHPLLAWWAVLFTLSMLARYEPEAWTAVTDVDRSRFAVPIEYVLDVAHDAVPEVLWETLSAAPALP